MSGNNFLVQLADIPPPVLLLVRDYVRNQVQKGVLQFAELFSPGLAAFSLQGLTNGLISWTKTSLPEFFQLLTQIGTHKNPLSNWKDKKAGIGDS